MHERYVTSAMGYVHLAENKNGPIPRPAAPSYIWGDALAELQRVQPHARIINLETAVTSSEDWLDKGINYRMHPDNVACLTAAQIDCCALANNHVLDWGAGGLIETVDTLAAAGIKTAGAGLNRAQAESAAWLPIHGQGRVLVYSFGMESSGIPPGWAASESRPGVYLLDEFAEEGLARLTRNIRSVKQPGDIVVASIHWGGNWGYQISRGEMRFARRLIDDAGVDIVHGHSSHHPKGIEVYAGKLILYGCGDFINDYEGIGGYEQFQPELGLMYFPSIDAATGRLLRLELVPMRMLRFRSQRACVGEARELCSMLEREGRQFGTSATLQPDQRIELRWRDRD
jgi:poly-gamma-glutamate synthesis protein (capsule biosynthesis protein)